MTDSDRSDSGACPTCGAVADQFVRLEATFRCTECMTKLDSCDAVPIGVLEDLADEWEKKDSHGKFAHAAKELQEVIETYE